MTAVEPGGGDRRALRRRRRRAQADGGLRAAAGRRELVSTAHGDRRQGGGRRGPRAGRRARSRSFAAELGRAPGLATVLVGDDPASADLRAPASARPDRGGRDALVPPRARRGDPARTSCSTWSRELNADDDGRRDPGPAAAARADRPGRGDRAIDPAKDVDGLTAGERRACSPRGARGWCRARRRA